MWDFASHHPVIFFLCVLIVSRHIAVIAYKLVR